MTPTIAVNLLTNIIFSLDESVSISGDFSRKIGEELYKTGGTNYLFSTMRLLTEELSRHNHCYIKTLEQCWDGIGER
jgi:5-bromo-4-chloroindolyl phosphate hydrolysis protein